jgi:hypothetical protein
MLAQRDLVLNVNNGKQMTAMISGSSPSMPLISDAKRSLFNTYAAEFEKTYLLEPIGQKHIAMYATERQQVLEHWEQIKNAKAEGQDITDAVLANLLPYSNTRHNREMGYHISVAPAITKDLRKFFQNRGWQEPGNWGNVASAIFALVYAVIEDGDWSALTTFEQDKSISRGFKAGFITPTLHCLNPKLRIINSKTIDTVNLLLDRHAIDRDLTHYKDYLEVIDQALVELDNHILHAPDVFDAFCHWMCDKRLGGYARIEKSEVVEEESEEDEGTPLFEEEVEPQGHWEAIYYLVKMGNLLGYKTYVADPSRSAFGKRLGDLATLAAVPPILSTAPEISRVDVIWYKSMPPFFLFEVEDGGTMREALHRLYNAIAFDARFFIISPAHNRDKFEKWATTAPFKEFEERYEFRTYAELFAFYQEVVQFTSMRSRFLRI